MSASTKSLKGMGEWLTAIGILGTVLAIFIVPLMAAPQFTAFKSALTQFSLAVFFAGVLLSIKDIKTKTEATEETLSRMKESFESAEKYGPAVNTVAGVLNRTSNTSSENAAAVHVRASGLTLNCHINEELPILAERLVHLYNGRGDMRLVEPYFVSGFLNRLQKLLPDGCVWCGVTRLTRGWVENNGEPGFSEFREKLRARVERKELSVFRIYNVGNDSSFGGFRLHIDKEVASGISARILENGDAKDVSLIWQLLKAEHRRLLEGAENPISVLSRIGAVPVCGLHFETRFASMFHSVSIVSGSAPEFQHLMDDFAGPWDRARPAYPPRSEPSPPPNGIDRRLVDFKAA